jgi:hypothetical protein
MSNGADRPTECAFCRITTPDLCISKRKDETGLIHTGALCRACIDAFILDMAYADPERFERIVAEARAGAGYSNQDITGSAAG